MLPIILIPGLLCTAEVFEAQTRTLWPYGSVMVANTLKGETMADIAAEILASAPAEFALGGISMGGYLSFEILRQVPDRVRKLALISTSARLDSREQGRLRRMMMERTRSLASMPEEQAGHLTEMFKSILHPEHRTETTLLAKTVRMSMEIGMENYARQVAAIGARVDSRQMLDTICVPTTVIVGDSDPLTPLDCAEEIVAAIPDARLVLLPRCGHLSTLEAPEAMNQALLEWIQSE